MKRVLAEACLVALAGTLFGLAGNSISPRGLKLSRNYFPAPLSAATPLTNAVVSGVSSDPVAERLAQKGLKTISCEAVQKLIGDPQVDSNEILILDARDDEHYHAGHIPKSYQFDHYHPEKYATSLIPLFSVASRIIVYCNGGDCEDSEFAALLLRDTFGVPADKIAVFAGGMKEWSKLNLPVETGERNSGVRK